MSLEEIREIFRKCIDDFGFCDELEDDMDLLEEEIIDSLMLIMILTEIEKHINMQIPVEDVIPENFSTINNTYLYIKRLTRG